MTTNLSQAQKLMPLFIINCTFYVMYVMGTYLQKRDTNIGEQQTVVILTVGF
jgi:hypothetical protein